MDNPWRDLPTAFGNWLSVYVRLSRWRKVASGHVWLTHGRGERRGTRIQLVFSFGRLIQINWRASFLTSLDEYKNKHPQTARRRTSAGRKMRGAWSLTAITTSDGAGAIVGLAARDATVCTVPIDAIRQHCCRRRQPALSATSRGLRRALAHKSSCASTCPALPLQASAIA